MDETDTAANGPTDGQNVPDAAASALAARKNLICQEILNHDTIRVGQRFASPASLEECVQEFAPKHTFAVIRKSNFICCSRFGKGKDDDDSKNEAADVDDEKKTRKSISLKAGCKCAVYYSFTDVIPKAERSPASKNKQKRKSDSLKITSIVGMHGPYCKLGVEEMKEMLRRGGQLSRPHLPAGTELSSQDVVNFCIAPL